MSNSPIVEILNDLKSNISRNSVGYAHITGENYRALLKHFGATEKDLQLMESGSLHKDVQVDIEPTMFFRQVSQLGDRSKFTGYLGRVLGKICLKILFFLKEVFAPFFYRLKKVTTPLFFRKNF